MREWKLSEKLAKKPKLIKALGIITSHPLTREYFKRNVVNHEDNQDLE